MQSLTESVEQLAEEAGFSGAVRVDVEGAQVLAAAYGMADRRSQIACTVDTRFGIASGTKALTALTVLSLIDDGQLEFATTARSVLGRDLPLIHDEVTVELLLSHRSGIGDYLDEEGDLDLDAYLMPVPVHELVTTEQYLRVLDGHAAKFAPGERFAYCNSGYVVLALIAERATGVAFHDLVEQRVCDPAGMRDTAFLRSDQLPARAAIGYLETPELRTNVFHLPVRGSGDGGIYSTVGDIHRLWSALFAGRILSGALLSELLVPRGELPGEPVRYGLGLWLHEERDAVRIEGMDAGVSFRGVHDPVRDITHTVLSNTARGAWPITRRLDELLRI